MLRHIPDGIVDLVPDLRDYLVPVLAHHPPTHQPFLQLPRVDINGNVRLLEESEGERNGRNKSLVVYLS